MPSLCSQHNKGGVRSKRRRVCINKEYQAPARGVNSIVDRLISAGARITLCDSDNPKAAIHKDFHTRIESSDSVKNHLDRGGNIGAFAYSLDSVVVDVDEGNPHQLMLDYQPYAQYPTRTPGHHHLWYPYHENLIPSYNFSMKGCSGQLLFKSSHVAIPNPSVTLPILYDGLVTKYHHTSPIPLYYLLSDIGDSHSISDIESVDIGDIESTREIAPPHPLTTVDTPKVGTRHIWILRQTIRALGLKELRSRDDVWSYVLKLFHSLDDKSDFPQAEALGIARWAVSLFEQDKLRWQYSREQRSRGGLNRARDARAATAERDRQILALAANGASLRRIAAQVGISKSQIDNIIKREQKND